MPVLFETVSRYPSMQNLHYKDLYVSNLLNLDVILDQFIETAVKTDHLLRLGHTRAYDHVATCVGPVTW